ncbi:hypothetical protein [Microbacterium dextranolyticum]|uniref:Uncharacterized protein n=1 Tax=Microbacterium dextranolyticum TaxID=36806 RepID=A0A9W6HK54_9MICO|nr:hypothetical protein [Microbacterium dextranolyticum]MBM7462073.1 hypothetical protein [Microbacterium dextranolyticum]GLJ94317.1 hypothetical protein GCM10017591_03780 [Microbacterium dextranolyticum]
MARPGADRRLSATRGGAITVAVAVIVLAIVVGALSVLALRQVRPASDAPSYQAPTSSVTPRTPTPHPTPTASHPQPSPSASATARPAAAPGAAERFLAIGADALWRATAGTCGGTAPVIEHSADGGATWQNVTPAAQPLAQVRGLTAISPHAAGIVADLGAACQTTTVRTYTDGQFWEPYPAQFGAESYAHTDGSVTLAGRTAATPCAEPWGLRVASDGTAGLICDGTAYVRSSGGWTALTMTAHALAATRGSVVVAHTDASCAGVRVTAYEPDARDLGCVETDPTQPVALDLTSTGAIVWTGDRTVRLG